ncbi:hypothetical protein L3476_14030 [Paenibacillus thiaminolyticus]|uniref:hypothetical protein n=1 Tax=Paenibacillus thiaminolyticus TaxID=49283 RepID=UPI00234FD205|nr:hypothetical protein [Paenibacillus thiaminolyticus]WCR29740.1 hypothetical protein L3476_14030 [Paenibacillus thiaminolyticus]
MNINSERVVQPLTNYIPAELKRDRYWGSLLFLFMHHQKLNRLLRAKYIDLNEQIVNVHGLRAAVRGWSHSEKFMLQLALHLFNERNKFNLSDMDYLDDYNKQLALRAIQIRFS